MLELGPVAHILSELFIGEREKSYLRPNATPRFLSEEGVQLVHCLADYDLEIRCIWQI
jgi:hypothetical protein